MACFATSCELVRWQPLKLVSILRSLEPSIPYLCSCAWLNVSLTTTHAVQFWPQKVDRTADTQCDLLPCSQAVPKMAGTFVVTGLEVLMRLERRADAKSGGGSARAATLGEHRMPHARRGARGVRGG